MFFRVDFTSKSVKLVFMREWERKDIADIAEDYGMEVSATAERWQAMHKSIRILMEAMPKTFGGDDTDNELIIIEHHLEVEHGLEWDGLQFVLGAEPYTAD